MNASKAKQRYWLTFLFEDLPIGAKFKPGLLHITAITWFVSDLTDEEILQSFKETFANLGPLELKVGEKKNFGPDRNVQVNLIDNNPKLTDLHQKSLKWLKMISGRWAVKNPYMDDEFTPHIRWRGNPAFKEGDIIIPQFLTLVKANRHEDNIREVAAKVRLT